MSHKNSKNFPIPVVWSVTFCVMYMLYHSTENSWKLNDPLSVPLTGTCAFWGTLYYSRVTNFIIDGLQNLTCWSCSLFVVVAFLISSSVLINKICSLGRFFHTLEFWFEKEQTPHSWIARVIGQKLNFKLPQTSKSQNFSCLMYILTETLLSGSKLNKHTKWFSLFHI